MQRLRVERPTQNHVMAVFEASALSFELPQAATLEDLADRLAHLSERHGGALISVDVRVNS
jgi:mannose/cellobiose epimerase-like protein (N-acyl-D-glucosamine 2-epimerase family)